MSDSEENECIDCSNDQGYIECELCKFYTCADCCQFVNGGNMYICRQCYSKLYLR